MAILSPESFECVVIRTALRSAKEWIHCLAIDEAHYIEQWYFMIIIFYCKCLSFCYYFCRFVQADSIYIALLLINAQHTNMNFIV